MIKQPNIHFRYFSGPDDDAGITIEFNAWRDDELAEMKRQCWRFDGEAFHQENLKRFTDELQKEFFNRELESDQTSQKVSTALKAVHELAEKIEDEDAREVYLKQIVPMINATEEEARTRRFSDLVVVLDRYMDFAKKDVSEDIHYVGAEVLPDWFDRKAVNIHGAPDIVDPATEKPVPFNRDLMKVIDQNPQAWADFYNDGVAITGWTDVIDGKDKVKILEEIFFTQGSYVSQRQIQKLLNSVGVSSLNWSRILKKEATIEVWPNAPELTRMGRELVQLWQSGLSGSIVSKWPEFKSGLTS